MFVEQFSISLITNYTFPKLQSTVSSCKIKSPKFGMQGPRWTPFAKSTEKRFAESEKSKKD